MPHLLYDWKLKIYLRVIAENKEGLTAEDPRTAKNRRIRSGQIGDSKRYRPA